VARVVKAKVVKVVKAKAKAKEATWDHHHQVDHQIQIAREPRQERQQLLVRARKKLLNMKCDDLEY
jgi:hypothetical protein